MQKNDDVTIIVPVYNEAAVVGPVVKELKKSFANIVCVDDGSTDKSVRVLEKLKASVVKHPINLGQGAAIQTGIEYGLLNENIKYFVTYDADGQHVVEDVLKMIDMIKKEKLDIVLGSRFLGSSENMSWLKRLVLKGGVLFSNTTSGIRLTDTHNGLRVFNRRTAMLLDITMSDFSHASEIIERIGEHKLRYAEAPVTIRYTEHSKKKGQSILNAVNISFDVLLRKVMKR